MHKLIAGDVFKVSRSMVANSVDFVFFSPFYPEARTYNLSNCILGDDWPEYMAEVTTEMCRVSKGFVAVNCSDSVEDGIYKGRPEEFFVAMKRRGFATVRPYIWAKQGEDFDDRGNGTPGSGGKRFHRNDYEVVYVFCHPDKFATAYTNNLAFGLPPKFKAGGSTTHRSRDGKRKNDGADYIPPRLSNAGNIIRARVGGGHMGHSLAHKNEAPMPLALAERFACWYTPKGGKVLDPFCGSGTTLHAAHIHGFEGIGIDYRESQCKLSYDRIVSIGGTALIEYSNDYQKA